MAIDNEADVRDGFDAAGFDVLRRTGRRYALCTMCVGVGQGIAIVLERV